MDVLLFNLEWMTFNLLLALLGVTFGIIFFYLKNKLAKLVFFLLFILFLPNTIYLITDVQHFPNQWGKLTFFYQILLVSQYVILFFLGIFTFILSLYFLDKFFLRSKIKKNKELITTLIIIINYLVSFGVGLGRIERIHSYEAIVNPLKVITTSISLLSSQEAMIIIFLFGTFINFLYFFFRGKFKIKMIY